MNLPKVFSETSDKSYDKHYYRVLLKNNTSKEFDNYEDLKYFWFQHSQIPDFLDVVTIHDKKIKSKPKGF